LNKGELLSEKALAYEGLGKKDEAEGVYKKIIANDPDDPFACFFMHAEAMMKGTGNRVLSTLNG
jgi:tetratricopeptide (TPR) repeat protein